MAGTVNSSIGGNAGVFFEYAGTGAALHMDIGFQPSIVEFKGAGGGSTLTWGWNRMQGYSDIATIDGFYPGAIGTGRAVTTLTDVSSITGIQIATDTTMNLNGMVYRGICWR